MKSLKKTLVLLVVFSMILSAVVPAFAATDIYGLDCEEEVARLEALKVVSGYEDGTFGPEKTITRAEMAVILCKMVGIDQVTAEENKYVPSKFSDVAAGEWYTGFVNVAAGKGLLSGYPDGTFRPSEQLTMNHVLTLCVNALGRGEYVAEMGTWPANYIAEATKLGLLDGVKTSDANRGNVAIICWNTLEAPYVWDVTNTEYEGTINLGNSAKSLLSIFFRDFSYDTGIWDNRDNFVATNRILKEAEYVEVVAVPATYSELGEYQIILYLTDDTDSDDYYALLNAIDKNKKPRGTDSEEWTSLEEDAIIAYAPEFDDLDSLYGKIVTVIFGKDNEVVSIRVIDETVEDEYLTLYKDQKLTIGSETYKFAKEADVYVNTQYIYEDSANDAMAEVADVLDIDLSKKFNKKIKADVVLNSDGKVTRLDLFVSGDYEEFYTAEDIVESTEDEEISLLKYPELNIDFSEDVDEDDLPRFIKDGKIVKATDVQVGDVLTFYYDVDDADITVKTVYISSERVSGELARVSKLKLTIDGEAYYSSDTKALVTSDEIEDAEEEIDMSEYAGENVEAYLNIYGEYVLVASEKVSENWTFGIITKVKEMKEDDEDYDISYIPVNVLLADGTTSREYQFVYDDDNDDDTIEVWENAVDALEGEFVVFSANANNEIEYFDAYIVTDEISDDTDGDFDAILAHANDSVDDSRQRISGKNFSSKTVIFNTGDGDKPSVSKKWKNLITNNDKLSQDTLLIWEEDQSKLSYVLINVSENNLPVSDALYAIVGPEEDYSESNKKYSNLLTVNGEENIEVRDSSDSYVNGLENYFIEYSLSGSKLNAVSKLIDLHEVKGLKVKGKVTNEIVSGSETRLVVDILGAASESHGTVACPVTDNTVTTCACTGFTAYQAAVDAVHAGGCPNAANLTATSCTCADFVAYQAAVNAVHGTVACDGECDGDCTGYVAARGATLKNNFKVVAAENLILTYAKEKSDIDDAMSFGDVEVDEDVIVYDARDGELKETTFSEIENSKNLYVIPFANEDAVGYGTSDVEANILVIVD